MRSPYHDDPSTSGIATLSQDELDELVMLADAHKIQVQLMRSVMVVSRWSSIATLKS